MIMSKPIAYVSKPIACFEKVSLEEFARSYGVTPDDPHVKKVYDQIKLPTRATTGSAGYDFYAPQSYIFVRGEPQTIITGIRCKIAPGWVLMLYPRSGMGFKYGFRLMNGTGIIDSDYYYADNEGHMMCKAYVTEKTIEIEQGGRYMQGVFVPYGLAENGNDEMADRTGGFGSTGV